jgi:asparagine synthase (glutamine-hydrolysing)
MCGICGVWGETEAGALERIVAALRHRGPDDQGTYQDERVALGSTRLAILDLTAAGHQPMANADGSVWIVYNGETYNYRAERDRLEGLGHRFRSRSDTEVVLRLYEEHGDAFLSRLRGMFALAIYDRRRGRGRERLLLARDPFGIKPLLYARMGGGLIFASEVKALLADGRIRREMDPVALRQLLCYGAIRQPRTALRDVRMLLPGHRLLLESGQFRIEAYWSPAARRPDLRLKDRDALIGETRATLEDSARLQLRSDVPLGAFLSGGIDSTLLVALMARHVGRPLRTFSVGFGTEGEAFDESDLAAQAARLIGTHHTRVVVRGEDVRDDLARIASALDQPTVDGVNSYYVAQAAARDVTVAISGLGGDELFAGYPWWFHSLLREEAHDLRHPWRAVGKRVAAFLTRPSSLDWIATLPHGALIRRCREFASWPSRFAARNVIFDPAQVARVMDPGLLRVADAGCSYHRDFAPADLLPDAPLLERITGLCVGAYMTDQLLRDVDAASMAHSLEVRVPFVDPAVADLALSLPSEVKIEAIAADTAATDDRGKLVLRDLLGRLLPGRREMPAKRGFNLPFAEWLRGPLRAILDDVLAPQSVRRRGLFEPRAVQAVRDGVQTGDENWAKAWVLTMTEMWCREVLDRASEPRA